MVQCPRLVDTENAAFGKAVAKSRPPGLLCFVVSGAKIRKTGQPLSLHHLGAATHKKRIQDKLAKENSSDRRYDKTDNQQIEVLLAGRPFSLKSLK
ncbi:hypothetical protein [Thalassobacillus sp. C254]|uniref:hypothetical protein n=1 Tax=Thalassobacillus sp. C254 TaxID=1225341 RepID=UPI0006D09684|nr:hypothetical protein [Thalassobacillus sp. C254]